MQLWLCCNLVDDIDIGTAWFLILHDRLGNTPDRLSQRERQLKLRRADFHLFQLQGRFSEPIRQVRGLMKAFPISAFFCFTAGLRKIDT